MSCILVYIVGCVLSAYVFVRLWTRELDLETAQIPIMAILTVLSWIGVGVGCLAWFMEWLSGHNTGRRVLLKRRG